MPRKPKHPDSPLSARSPQVNIKLTESMNERLDDLCRHNGQSRGEVGRDLLHRGYLHLAREAHHGTDGDRELLGQELDYIGAHLTLVLSGHSQLDPEGAVVGARNFARYVASWADERALDARLALLALDGEV